jgi:nucleotide-binding universal stress UspA family protein
MGVDAPAIAEGGSMFRDILILFDNQEICPEALDYAREFALRMDARVTLLMLARMSFLGRTFLDSKRADLSRIEDSAARLLSQSSEIFIQAGIEVGSAFKVGEPAQELLKFLADHPPFQAIIWGSGPDLPGRGHWIGRATGKMECSLLTVSKKGAALTK